MLEKPQVLNLIVNLWYLAAIPNYFLKTTNDYTRIEDLTSDLCQATTGQRDKGDVKWRDYRPVADDV